MISWAILSTANPRDKDPLIGKRSSWRLQNYFFFLDLATLAKTFAVSADA